MQKFFEAVNVKLVSCEHIYEFAKGKKAGIVALCVDDIDTAARMLSNMPADLRAPYSTVAKVIEKHTTEEL